MLHLRTPKPREIGWDGGEGLIYYILYCILYALSKDTQAKGGWMGWW